MTGIVKSFDALSGKGFITPSDGRKDVLLHISAVYSSESESLIPGGRVEFCRINGLKGPTAANIYLSWSSTVHRTFAAYQTDSYTKARDDDISPRLAEHKNLTITQKDLDGRGAEYDMV